MKNRIYQRIVMIGMIVAFVVSFAGCGRNETTDCKDLSIDVADLAEKIVKEGSFKDEMNQMDDELFGAEFEGVDESLITEKCVYIGTGATAEQVVIIKAKDAAAAEQLKEQLHTKLSDDMEENKDYNAEEVAKLQSAVLKVEGNYDIMVVSGDSKKVEEIMKLNCK